MGSVCCSEGKPGANDDECVPERASGRYSSLNPSRRCSFMLDSPRPSADNTFLAKSPVPGSPAANGRDALGMSAEDISEALQVEYSYSNPMFSPLLIKLLRPGGKQVHAAKEGGPRSEGVSRRGSSNASPVMTTLSCSLDVEPMSTEWPSWQDQKISDLTRHEELQERWCSQYRNM